MATLRNTEHFNVITDIYLACPCCGKGRLAIATFILLEVVRGHFNAAVTIDSACRCAKHNHEVGGAENSEHLIHEGRDVTAVDIKVKGHTPQEVYLFLKNLPYANLLGIGKYKSFTHVDTRGYGARW